MTGLLVLNHSSVNGTSDPVAVLTDVFALVN